MGWRNIWSRPSRGLRALRSCVAGAAAVEFAIIAPIIGLVLAGTIDLAQFANAGLVLDGALRAGAAYAIADPTNQPAIKCIIGDPSLGCPAGFGAYASFPSGATVTVSFCSPGSGCPPAPTGASAPQFCTMDNSTTATPCDNTANPCSALPNQCPKHSYIKIQAVESGLSPTMQWALMPTSVTRTLTVRVP